MCVCECVYSVYTVLFMLSRLFHHPDEVHTYTGCQIHSPVSTGEMSFSLPLFEIFSPKKEMENSGLRRGGRVTRGGRGREKTVGERGRRKERMFTSGVAPWHFHFGGVEGSAPHAGLFGFIRRRGWVGGVTASRKGHRRSCEDANWIILNRFNYPQVS